MDRLWPRPRRKEQRESGKRESITIYGFMKHPVRSQCCVCVLFAYLIDLQLCKHVLGDLEFRTIRAAKAIYLSP
jgi:hypothetical protein